MIDMSLFRSHLQNIQTQRNPSREIAQGINTELTPEAVARNTMNAMRKGQSPVLGLVSPSEVEEMKRDFPERIN